MKDYGFDDLRTVIEVAEVEHSFADIAVITDGQTVREARTHWLKNHREDLQFAGQENGQPDENSFIQFRVKE
jgi:hypothetical protein